MEKEIKYNFQVSSRLPLLLGDELIPDAGYAVFELVKNSHDADAASVFIDLRNIDSANSGSIAVEDDGEGMDIDDIRGSWMVLGTPNRRRQTKEGRFTSIYRRTYLGEKGIGRFAVHKLGKKIELVTRKINCLEYFIRIDWDEFDPEMPKMLDDIPMEIIERDPIYFTGNNSGTRISITSLREGWSRGQVRNLHRTVNSICSPFNAPEDFQAVMTVKPQEGWLEHLFSFDEAREKALFTAECTLEGLSFIYSYAMKSFESLKQQVEGRSEYHKGVLPLLREDDADPDDENQSELRFSSIEAETLAGFGKIELRLMMYDLTPTVLNLIVGADKDGLKRFLKRNGGIRVYRNGVRIFGMGGAGEDWLNLGGRRVQLPQRRLSNNQVIGAVMLNQETGEHLKEQTNRRGFIENTEFRLLRKALLYVISQVEAARFKDKERIKAVLTSSRQVRIPVMNELRELRDRLSKLSEEDRETIEPAVVRVERAYSETRDTLVNAASSGLAIAGVVHNLEKQVKNLDAAVNSEDFRIGDIKEQVLQLSVLMEGLTAILRKSPKSRQSAERMVKTVLFNMNHRLRKHRIEVVNGFDTGSDFTISCPQPQTNAAIINIIDNSIHWLGLKGHSNRRIYIGPSNEYRFGPAVIVADNGPGFTDSPGDLVRAFFSRKHDGMGLGLYLADQFMNNINGRLEFPEPGDVDLNKGFNGAVVAFIFREDAT